MAELIAVGFQGTRRAAEVLDQLEMLDSIWAIELKDAVAAYRADDGRLHIHKSLHLTTKEESIRAGALGALIGALLLSPVAAVIAVPLGSTWVGLSGAALGATAGAAVGHDEATMRERYGISEEFVKQVARMVQPGHSALFALLRAADPDVVVEQFRGYGGTILRTTLGGEAAHTLQAVLDD
jgi:uncharacterized membrane protein